MSEKKKVKYNGMFSGLTKNQYELRKMDNLLISTDAQTFRNCDKSVVLGCKIVNHPRSEFDSGGFMNIVLK